MNQENRKAGKLKFDAINVAGVDDFSWMCGFQLNLFREYQRKKQR